MTSITGTSPTTGTPDPILKGWGDILNVAVDTIGPAGKPFIPQEHGYDSKDADQTPGYNPKLDSNKAQTAPKAGTSKDADQHGRQ